MKKLLILLLLILLGVGGYLWYRGDLDPYIEQVQRYIPSSKVEIGENPVLIRYALDGKPTGGWMLSVPWTWGQPGNTFVTAWLGEEKVVDNFPIATGTGGILRNNVSFAPVGEVGNSVEVRIAASSSPIGDEWDGQVTSTVEMEKFTLSPQTAWLEVVLDTSKVTKRDEAMLGSGFILKRDDTGSGSLLRDITQHVNECGPTAATNALYELLARHGMTDKLADDPRAVIDRLKGAMAWSQENGVSPDGFVSGMDKWAEKVGVPIGTEKVGGPNGVGTLEALKQALDAGGTAQVRLRFLKPETKETALGHMVSVVGVRMVNGNAYIDIHDPASPPGTDSYFVSGRELLGYGLWRAPAYLGWGFTQTWEEEGRGTQPTPNQPIRIDGVAEPLRGGGKLQVIRYDGHILPVTGLRLEESEDCMEGNLPLPHWHAKEGMRAKNLTNGWVPDPNPTGCGYGKARDIPAMDVEDTR